MGIDVVGLPNSIKNAKISAHNPAFGKTGEKSEENSNNTGMIVAGLAAAAVLGAAVVMMAKGKGSKVVKETQEAVGNKPQEVVNNATQGVEQAVEKNTGDAAKVVKETQEAVGNKSQEVVNNATQSVEQAVEKNTGDATKVVDDAQAVLASRINELRNIPGLEGYSDDTLKWISKLSDKEIAQVAKWGEIKVDGHPRLTDYDLGALCCSWNDEKKLALMDMMIKDPAFNFYHGKQLGRLSWWSEDVIKEVKSLLSHPDFGKYPSFDDMLANAAYLKIKEPKQFERLEKLFKLADFSPAWGGYRTYFRAAKVKDESVFTKILKIAPDTKNKIIEKRRAAVDEIEKILAEYETSLKD